MEFSPPSKLSMALQSNIILRFLLQLRDREMELKAQIAAITSSSKEGEQAEAEAGEGSGPQVNDQHIADIVAQWTGIPIDKVSQKLHFCLGQSYMTVGFVLLRHSICIGTALLHYSCCDHHLNFGSLKAPELQMRIDLHGCNLAPLPAFLNLSCGRCPVTRLSGSSRWRRRSISASLGRRRPWLLFPGQSGEPASA